MLTILTTAVARTRQSAAVRAARVAGEAMWRGFGMNTASRSVRGFIASICAARVSATRNTIVTVNTNSYRHTNKFSSALVVPAPRVSTVLHT